MNSDTEFQVFAAAAVSDAHLAQCASLFSAHYGTWGIAANPSILRGKPVKMNPSKLKTDFLFDGSCFLAEATLDGELLGHATFTRFETDQKQGRTCYSRSFKSASNSCSEIGTVVWINQLVVHRARRRRRIATNLLSRAFDKSRDIAAGIVSSNPFAICALERNTGILAIPGAVARAKTGDLLRASKVPYLQGRRNIHQPKRVYDRH